MILKGDAVMAIRNIVKKGDGILRKKSREVTEINDRLITLLDDMYETMLDDNGVGLAAVQVGILRRVVVIDIGDGKIELINPKIIASDGEQREIEGCLSCPGENGYTVRPMKVTVEALNRYGEKFTVTGEGLLARAFCHELDHLDGILFIDKAVEMLEPDEY